MLTNVAILMNKEDLPQLNKKDLVAVCSWCRKIRDPYGGWIDPGVMCFKYFGEKFTHTICEECCSLYFPDFSDGIIESHQQ
jgi:hypothetical protein